MISMSLRSLLIISLLSLPMPAICAERDTIILDNGNDIDIEKYPSAGNNLLLWLPSEHGLTAGLQKLASDLARRGIEVWIADPFSTWFLNTTTDSLEKIDRDDYSRLLSKAIAGGKKVILASNDRGTSVLLETARRWQLTHTEKSLHGAIIISPNLYIETPGAGQEAEYLPVVDTTRLNMLLMTPKKSTAFLRLEALQSALANAGSNVFVQPLPAVRDRFFFRQDATEPEQQASAILAQQIKHGIQLLLKVPAPNKVSTIETAVETKKSSSSTTGKALPFKGNWEPPLFTLFDLAGKKHVLSDFRGRVLLVNFWASWCPPCVHEIPSMTRLKDTFRDYDFDILAVNLGEDKASIESFLQQHPVNFPVLLDPGQTQPKQWKVFAFPTSYLLDRNGRIRYSVAGGIDWSDPEIRQIVNELLDER